VEFCAIRFGDGTDGPRCSAAALADALDQHRAAVLGPSSSNANSETEGENVPGTLDQIA
jgi:hypothetical protein